MLRAMNRTITVSLAVASTLLAVQTAAADTKSWTALKKVVGKGDNGIVSIDFAKLRGTAAFQAGLKMFLDEETEAKGVLDAIKADCKIDVFTAVTDLTVAMQDGDHPLIAVGLDGVDEAKFTACMGLVVSKMMNLPPVTFTATRKGKISEYSVKGEPKKLYMGWLAKDVLVFTEEVNDGKLLASRLAGKGAKGDLAKFVGKAAKSSAMWLAVADKDVEDGRTIMGGYGQLEVAAGTLKLSGAVVMSKPAEATSMATEGTAAIGELKSQAGAQVPELGRLLSTVVIAAKGSDVAISGSIADKDLAALIPQLDKLF
jgi:hypothetical protein